MMPILPVSKNIMPRTTRVQDYKPWQRLAIARATQATIERPKTDNLGKEAYALRSFVTNCEDIVRDYKGLLHHSSSSAGPADDDERGTAPTDRLVESLKERKPDKLFAVQTANSAQV